MAHLEPMGVEALTKLSAGLQQMSWDIDDIAKECIEAGNPLLESIYRNTMSGASPSLGKAAASTNTTPAKKNSLGIYSVSRAVGWNPGVSPNSPESFHKWELQHKSRYAMIAALFNYGVGAHRVDFHTTNAYGKSAFVTHGSAMHPGMRVKGGGWLDKAAKTAEGPVTQVVNRKFDEKVKELLG